MVILRGRRLRRFGAVAVARPTHLVGYASVIGRLARAALAGELDIVPSG